MVLRRVALTGASGMLARHLLAKLAAEGCECIATSRTEPAALPEGARWFSWDLREWRDEAELDRLFAGAEALIHNGAPVPERPEGLPLADLLDASVRATACLGHWARQRGLPMVFISGAIVYADPERDGIRETDATACWAPWWDYSLSKLLSEQVLEAFAGLGLELCILRPSSIYGSGMDARKLVPRWLDQARRGETISPAPPVDDRINLVHASDVAEAAVRVLERGVTGTFNLAAERPVTLREIAEACVAAAGSGAVRIDSDPDAAAQPAKTRFGLDCSAARERFGFAPELDFAAGLSRMWAEMSRHPS